MSNPSKNNPENKESKDNEKQRESSQLDVTLTNEDLDVDYKNESNFIKSLSIDGYNAPAEKKKNENFNSSLIMSVNGSYGFMKNDSHKQRHSRFVQYPTNHSNLHNPSIVSFVVPFCETSVRVSEAREQLKEGVIPSEKSINQNKHEIEMTDHLVSMTSLCKQLGTSSTEGLTSERAQELLEKYGNNELTPPKQKPLWLKLLLEMVTPFAIVLWISAFLTIIAFSIPSASNDVSNLIVGIALILIILITGVFSFYQNNKGSSAMSGFRSMMPQSTTVIRDGQKQFIDATKVVPGDLVVINVGDKFPADLRVCESEHLQVDNSCLTGETEPQTRTTEATNDNPLETSNLAFASTTAVGGSGRGIVIQTGDETMIGKLASLVSNGTAKVKTPMMIEINNFVKLITVFGATLGAVFLIVGLVRGNDWVETLVLCIGIIVANVPEGLPSAIAVSLALAAKRMAKKNVLVTDKLNVVETLGRTTVICSDKTGTLTQNIMTVNHIWVDGEIEIATDAIKLFGKGNIYKEDSSFFPFYNVGALCSRAEFIVKENIKEDEALNPNTREVLGDASETAILKFCDKIQSVTNFRDRCPKVAEIPFNSTNKYQVSLHSLKDCNVDKCKYFIDPEGETDILLVMKGAPERILSRCTFLFQHGKKIPFEDSLREKFMSDYNALAGNGERVLGFCSTFLPKNKFPLDFQFDTQTPNFPLENLTFVGAISMIDPPRASVPAAIKDCKTASIRVVMVTGDHPVTAAAISKSIGILSIDPQEKDEVEKYNDDVEKKQVESQTGKSSIIIHGDKLKQMNDEELYRCLEMDEIVFARTSPQQKLRIVEAFQHLGHIVAVTGDGVNDSPALKQAHVGVAMGITGTDVSKDASDIILADDNFGSIVNGIAEGRVIFDNLKKSIAYTLSSKCPETIPFLLSFFFYLPAPLSTILILGIDIGTDLLPAISLAYEPQEKSVMKRPPRGDSINDKLLTPGSLIFSYVFLGLIQSLAGFTSYFLLMSKGGGIRDGYWTINTLFFNKDFTESTGVVYDSATPSNPWTYNERMDLLSKAQTSYFVTVLVVRCFCLFTTKTVERSLFKHGFFNNRILLLGALEILGMALLIAYVYPFQFIFGTDSIPYYIWFVGFPFGLFLLMMDEVRKFAVRRNVRWLMY